MMRKFLDRLLILHFRDTPADSRLDRLEQDVWRKIHGASAEASLPWQEKMFLAFGLPQFRLASLAVAVMLGIALGPVFSPGNVVRANSGITDMQVFTAHAPYLMANLIGRME